MHGLPICCKIIRSGDPRDQIKYSSGVVITIFEAATNSASLGRPLFPLTINMSHLPSHDGREWGLIHPDSQQRGTRHSISTRNGRAQKKKGDSPAAPICRSPPGRATIHGRVAPINNSVTRRPIFGTRGTQGGQPLWAAGLGRSLIELPATFTGTNWRAGRYHAL